MAVHDCFRHEGCSLIICSCDKHQYRIAIGKQQANMPPSAIHVNTPVAVAVAVAPPHPHPHPHSFAPASNTMVRDIVAEKVVEEVIEAGVERAADNLFPDPGVTLPVEPPREEGDGGSGGDDEDCDGDEECDEICELLCCCLLG
eukprot:scaffold2265_cov98-Skeletonema_dohrnii-CCMP3373.AAC.8